MGLCKRTFVACDVFQPKGLKRVMPSSSILDTAIPQC